MSNPILNTREAKRYTLFPYHFLNHKNPLLFPLCSYCSSAMARIKNPKGPSRKTVPASSEENSSAASEKHSADPEVPPASSPMAASGSGKRVKSLARKSTIPVTPTTVNRNPLASSPPGLRDLNKEPPEDGDDEASLPSKDSPAPVSTRTRGALSSPPKSKERKKPAEKVSSSKTKKEHLKNNPPSASSSKTPSEPLEEHSESEDVHSTFSPNAEDVPEQSLPSMETETEAVATEATVVATSSKKKGKAKVTPAKVAPSSAKPSLRKENKRSLPPLSSLPHAKKKKPTGITLANFTPYSSYFCYNDNARDMKVYEGRNFIPEKNFDVVAHRPFGILPPLLQRQWLGSLDGVSGYVDRVVREFYANLTEECMDENSFMFERVYVRGNWCSFSPKDVADALEVPYPIDTPEVPFDRAAIFAELCGDPNVEVQESMHISHLTYQNATLMRFAISNWIPCSNMVNVSNELAFFLFKFSTGVPIDLAETIYEQIMSFRKGKKPKLNLVFPHLIYKVISAQHDLMLENESLETASRGQTFRVLDRSSLAKGSKKGGKLETTEDQDPSPAAASSSSAASDIAVLTARLSRMEIGQGHILKKLETISEHLHTGSG